MTLTDEQRRFAAFTDAELKVLDDALACAHMEGEIVGEDCEWIRNELAGELLNRSL